MREIKFMMWDARYSGRMISWEEILENFKCSIFSPEKSELIKIQFTGLKDKNGKEIYEGNITNIGVVEFKFGKWLAVNKQDDLETKILFDVVSDDNYVEIIGNIYENPELLKGGEK